jgi:signal transduction histidine kinase
MNRYPIIWLYVAWSVAQVTLVINAVFYHTPFSETTIPYVIASLLSLIVLPLAVKWTRSPQRVEVMHVRERFILLAIGAIIVTNISGMVIQHYLESEIPGLSGSPIGASLLLSMNVLVMFALTYLAWTLLAESRGRVSAEVMSVGFLILLVVPTILKGNYADWTSGWWAAEVFLLVTFLFGPAFLGSLYVRELARAESSQNRATLFADLLVHDISNYHQAILVCLNLLEMDDLPAGLKEQTLLDANSELMRADSLIRNVRRLGMVDRLAESSFVSVDLVQSIRESYQIVARTPTARGLRFSVDKEQGQCFVEANPLLTDVFLNLFYNSVQYAKDELVIDVRISPVTREGRSWWEIRVADHSRGIDAERKARLFERYMDRAHGTGLGLSVVYALVQAFRGSVSVEDRVPDDYSKGTVFIITLPLAKGPPMQPSGPAT